MGEDTELLKEIRNALRFLVSQHFTTRSAGSIADFKKEEEFIEASINRIMETGQ